MYILGSVVYIGAQTEASVPYVKEYDTRISPEVSTCNLIFYRSGYELVQYHRHLGGLKLQTWYRETLEGGYSASRTYQSYVYTGTVDDSEVSSDSISFLGSVAEIMELKF